MGYRTMEHAENIPQTENTAKRKRAVAHVSLFTMTFLLMMVLMLAFRTLVFSIHRVSGNGLTPLFQNGDHLLVNRCSYGLRIEGNKLLPYSRLLRQPVRRGDIVAFSMPNDAVSGLMIARCTAVPGDTIHTLDGTLLVPGLSTCAKTDYYWLEAINQKNPVDSRHIGFVPESHIIGRVVTVLYNPTNLRLP